MIIALAGILLGGALSLLGLLSVSSQVRQHTIQVASWPARILQIGALVLIGSIVLGFFTGLDPVVYQLPLIVGAATIIAGITILLHERQQSGYLFGRSLSLQVLIAGAVELLLALIGR